MPLKETSTNTITDSIKNRREIMRVASACIALCLVGAACHAQTPITTERIAIGFTRLVFATHAPGDTRRLFVGEQHTGQIKIVNLDTGVTNPTPFLTITGLSFGNEEGLLGLTFDPDYANNGFFYVDYTAADRTTWIVRYTVSANPDIADPASAHTIITIAQPFTNHNGGWIGFGPNDGYLYIAMGDGGSGGDPGNRAQTITNQLLGKMLRLDPHGDDFPADPTRNYAIPPTNPFVGVTGDDEIWAYGLRNPWRDSFDRVTGDLYFGDVGQNAWEEIDFQPADSLGGENYGWRCYEGNHPFNTGGCPPQNTLVFPVHEFSHAQGCSITGGYVYRGCAVPDLQGTYFFADFCSNRIWSFRLVAGAVTQFTDRTVELRPAGATIGSISSFGEDANGEIYICDMNGGEIFKIIPDGVPPVPCACSCACDWDPDPACDIFDFLAFQTAFVAGEQCACEFDPDPACNIFDFLAFQTQFVVGCP